MKAKRQLIAGGIIALACVVSCTIASNAFSSAVTSHSPEAQARATVMLRVTPVPTPVPVPTQNPEVVAAWDDAEIQAAQTFRSGVTFVVAAACVLFVGVCAAGLTWAASRAWRDVKATAQLSPMARVPGGPNDQAQLTDGVWDKRSNAWTVTGGEDKPGNNDLADTEARRAIGLEFARRTQGAEAAQAQWLLEQG